MSETCVVLIGVDAAKAKDAVAVVEPNWNGELRYIGEVDAAAKAVNAPSMTSPRHVKEAHSGGPMHEESWMTRFTFVVVGLLAWSNVVYAQQADAPTVAGTGHGPSPSLGEAAHISGPHQAIVRSTRTGGPAQPFDWTTITVTTSVGTARGITVGLATRDGGARSLMLDADEVGPLLAYLEGMSLPSARTSVGTILDFRYFQLRSGASIITFPAFPAVRFMFGDVLGFVTGGGNPGDLGQIEGNEQIEKFRSSLRAAATALSEHSSR